MEKSYDKRWEQQECIFLFLYLNLYFFTSYHGRVTLRLAWAGSTVIPRPRRKPLWNSACTVIEIWSKLWYNGSNVLVTLDLLMSRTNPVIGHGHLLFYVIVFFSSRPLFSSVLHDGKYPYTCRHYGFLESSGESINRNILLPNWQNDIDANWYVHTRRVTSACRSWPIISFPLLLGNFEHR